MLLAAIILFALAALLGLYLLSYVLQSKTTPKGVAFVHGPLAVTGLIILLVYSYYNAPSPWISIILFILAAMGGFMLIYKDIFEQSVPKALAIGHGITAVIGFIFLIVFTFFNTYPLP